MVGGADEAIQALRLAIREELSLFFGIDPEDAQSRRAARDTWNFLTSLHRESEAREARRASMGNEVMKGGVGAFVGAAVAALLGWLVIHVSGPTK